MVLLDTNVISEPTKKKPYEPVIEWLDEQVPEQTFLSAITVAEMQLGIALLPNGKRKDETSRLITGILDEFDGRILPFDAKAAYCYGQLVGDLRTRGQQISVEDAQIAAIAITNGLSLATRNIKDFTSIERLSLINPWEDA